MRARNDRRPVLGGHAQGGGGGEADGAGGGQRGQRLCAQKEHRPQRSWSTGPGAEQVRLQDRVQ